MTTPAIDIAPAVPPTATSPVAASRAPAVRRGRVTWATRAASILISAAALVILLRRVDLPAAVHTASREPLLVLVATVALNAVATWVRALRSQRVLFALGHPVGGRRNAAVQLAGQTLSWVSPAAAGDFVRPYLWRAHDGVPLTPGAVTVVYERVISFAQLGLVGAACVAPFALHGGALAAVAAATAALFALPWLATRVVRVRPTAHIGGGRGWRSRLLGAGSELWRLSGDGALALVFAGLTVATIAVSALQIDLLAAGIGIHIPFWLAVAAYALPQVVGSASSLPFGLGPADAVLVAILSHGGVDGAGALAITLLTRLVVTVPLGLAGAATYIWLSRRAPDARDAAVPAG